MLDRLHSSFFAVIQHKSYTKAAEYLHLSQPAISQQIRKLEDQYGRQLVILKNKVLMPTKEGQVIVNYIAQVVDLENRMRREIDNVSNHVKQYVLGASLTLGEYFLPNVLGRYRAHCPQDDVQLRVENTASIQDKLFHEEIDLGFIEGDFDRDLFEFRDFAVDKLFVVAAPDFALPKTPLSMVQLLALPLILREEGSGTRQIFERYIPPDLVLNPYMSIGSFTAIKSMVQQGLGLSVLSHLVVKRELEAGTLVVIPVEDLQITRQLRFIYRCTSPLGFIKRFADLCDELYSL